jgi:hypothetical protein
MFAKMLSKEHFLYLVFPPKHVFLVSSFDISNTTGLSLVFGELSGLLATTNISAYPIDPFFGQFREEKLNGPPVLCLNTKRSFSADS